MSNEINTIYSYEHFMKLHRKIKQAIPFLQSTVTRRELIGLLGAMIAHVFFLTEIVEFVGFNVLRIFFSIVVFANFSLLLFSIFQHYRIRIFGLGIYLLLLWSNVIHFRFFGSTMHLGSILNFGFLPILGSQIMYLFRWTDSVYLLSLITGLIFFKHSNILSIQKRKYQIAILTGTYIILQVFLYFAATQSSLNSARKYNEPFTRWDIYKEIRIESRDHTGSVLYFGFLWTYGVDLYRMNKNPGQSEPIPETNFSIDIPPGKRRNIIVIQVESLDNNVIHHTVGDQLVMPFLHRLTEGSIYFPNIFAQHTSVGGTSDAEFSMLTSQYPLGKKGAFFANGLEKLPSVPALLNRNGYVTLVFHGNSGSYFNRKQGMMQLGFQETFFKNDFTITDPDKWHALKDKDFFLQVEKTLSGTNNPYFAFILTLTSHTPFDLIDESDFTVDFNIKNPLVRNYLNSMAYVDGVLEEFISTMQQTDPNSLIIIFGDHCANINEPEYASYDIKGLEPIPLFILDQMNPSKMELSISGSTIDISPTLFDYLGVDLPTFWQGKSLLDEQNTKNTFILNSQYYFDANRTMQKISDRSVDTKELYRIQKYIW